MSRKERLVDPSTAWEKLSVRWSNGATRELLAFSGTSLWHTPGKPPVDIRWVGVRDPHGEIEDTPPVRTDLGATAQQIIEWLVPRWSMDLETVKGMSQFRWSCDDCRRCLRCWGRDLTLDIRSC